MKIKINKRWRWLLGGLSLSMALVISGHFSDKPETASARVTGNSDHLTRIQQRTMSVNSRLVNLARLKRDRSPGEVNDVFRAKSWYTAPPPVKAPPPPAPVAPPLPFSFLGKVQKSNGKMTIVISDKTHVYLVNGGETLNNNYHVDGIENGKLALTYLPMKKKQYIKLSGEQ